MVEAPETAAAIDSEPKTPEIDGKDKEKKRKSKSAISQEQLNQIYETINQV